MEALTRVLRIYSPTRSAGGITSCSKRASLTVLVLWPVSWNTSARFDDKKGDILNRTHWTNVSRYRCINITSSPPAPSHFYPFPFSFFSFSDHSIHSLWSLTPPPNHALRYQHSPISTSRIYVNNEAIVLTLCRLSRQKRIFVSFTHIKSLPTTKSASFWIKLKPFLKRCAWYSDYFDAKLTTDMHSALLLKEAMLKTFLAVAAPD